MVTRDGDEAYRAHFNAGLKRQVDCIIRAVQWSGLSNQVQADTMAGLTAYLFGAAVVARAQANPDEPPEHAGDVLKARMPLGPQPLLIEGG